VSIGDGLDLDLQDGRVMLSPAQRHPREGWAEAGEGGLEWPDHELASDAGWTW
jgi:hypothetical protein